MPVEGAGIHARLTDRFGDAVGALEGTGNDAAATVEPVRIAEVCRFLRDEPALLFDCLSNLSALDYPDKGVIQVVYNLFSYKHRHEITLKVDVARAHPVVKTVERVWPAANWLEREAYDLLGVVFEGHSDLRRILLPDDWIGWPLRKDYVEAPEYHGISTVRESMLDLPGRS